MSKSKIIIAVILIVVPLSFIFWIDDHSRELFGSISGFFAGISLAFGIVILSKQISKKKT